LRSSARARTAGSRVVRSEHDPDVRNHPLIVELDPRTVQSDSPVIVHQGGDLLTAGPGCPIQP